LAAVPVRRTPDAPGAPARHPELMTTAAELTQEERHEFWRMQLLDELYGKLTAIEAEPALDPKGKRHAELLALIARFEEIEAEELRNHHAA
jgi:hypothetical protein